jgi:hypothetical protein
MKSRERKVRTMVLTEEKGGVVQKAHGKSRDLVLPSVLSLP